MSFSHILTLNWNHSNLIINKQVTVTTDAEDNRDVTVADGSPHTQSIIAIDVSKLKSLYMLSDQDMLVESNDDTSPAANFNLKANVPLVWTPDMPFANPFGATDVTSLFFTNASGTSATVQIRLLQDAP